MALHEQHPALAQTRQWLEQVVIGLNLCPFAHKPNRLGLIDLVLCDAQTEEGVLVALEAQMQRLDQQSPESLETVVLVLTDCLQDFFDYNQFLELADGLIEEADWLGVYQVASFHPDYCFANVAPDDQSNLTNRSPYPLLHIIREDSLAQALDAYPNSDQIPDVNVARVCSLSPAEVARLFPHLHKGKVSQTND